MYIDMAGYFPLKLKRKDLEEVNDDFSDFSLSSPARKIRRLDAELPPIMEEEEPETALVPEHSMSVVEEENLAGGGGGLIQELAPAPANEERAIILFQPMNMPNLQSPSNYSISVSPDIISGIKNHMLWSNHCNSVEQEEEEEEDGVVAGRKEVENDTSSSKRRECFAMVPWVPSQFPPTPNAEVSEEAEEMDIEDDIGGAAEHGPRGDGSHWGLSSSRGGLHQQHYCMFPQFPPQNPSSPLVWHH